MKLGEIADIQSGRTPDKDNSEYWGGNIPWYTPSEIPTAYFENGGEPVYITEKCIEDREASVAESGDIILSARGTVGLTHLCDQKTSANQSCYIISVKDDNKITPEYLYYALQAGKKTLDRYSAGSTFDAITTKLLTQVEVSVPPVEEQERIVSLLSDVDEYIERSRERHTNLKQQKQALAQDIFESEDEWNTVSVSDVCTINPESFTPEDYDEEELPYLSLSCVSDGQLVDIEHVDVQDPRDRATRLVRENDVLVGTVEPKNKSHYRIKKDQDGFVASSGFIVLRSDEDILPEYLEQYVLSRAFFRQMDAFASGSTYPAVSLTNFKKMRISYPSVEEQQEIGEVLSTIDELLKNVQEDISAVREFKQGLLNQMFS